MSGWAEPATAGLCTQRPSEWMVRCTLWLAHRIFQFILFYWWLGDLCLVEDFRLDLSPRTHQSRTVGSGGLDIKRLEVMVPSLGDSRWLSGAMRTANWVMGVWAGRATPSGTSWLVMKLFL